MSGESQGAPTELIGGPEQRTIAVVDYDPEWSDVFQIQRARVRGEFGCEVRVEHIGSTAVPGLAAKPVVDIQVSVGDIEAEADYLPALEAPGYVLRVREPEHRMVRTPELDVHIHVCAVGGAWERRHLLFRDWLRNDATDRLAYEAVKRDLASRNWPTMNHYAAAKSGFIASALQRAESWAGSTGWAP